MIKFSWDLINSVLWVVSHSEVWNLKLLWKWTKWVHDDNSKMGHSAKLETDGKSTIFLQPTWNLGKIIFSWNGYINQVSLY